jgi:hypothetical protein
LICPNPDCPHARETGEPAEYRAEFTRCSDCGSELVETSPAESAGGPEEVEYEELVSLLELPNSGVASFVQSLLAGAGIRFTIRGGLVGFNVAAAPPVLFVAPSRAEEARELLAQVETDGQGDDREPSVRQIGATWGKHFRSEPHIARVLLYGVASALSIAYGAAALLRDLRPDTILVLPPHETALVFGVLFALFALDNWRRLNEEKEKNLLPHRFRCPDCGAPIALSSEEREKSHFRCNSCREDFEVDG